MISVEGDAIDSNVLLADGSRKKLSDFWTHKPVVLVFLRHYG